MSTPAAPDPTPAAGPRRTPAAERAERFLARVLPGSDDEVGSDASDGGAAAERPAPGGVDPLTQSRLEAMGAPDRESW